MSGAEPPTRTDAAPATEFATSVDGTRIAFSRSGIGPTLVLVDGALCHRGFGPSKPFTKQLKDSFTVVSYDRRGRGESGGGVVASTHPEVEDLRAVIDAVGTGDVGSPGVFVLGFSSGAALAYRAAAAGVPIRKLVGYEAPFVGLRTGKNGVAPDYLGDLEAMLAKDERGRMVDYFMVRMVGGPFFLPVMFRLMGGIWKQMQRVAPTLVNDARAMGGDFEVPAEEFSRIRVPVLVASGSKAAPEMAAAQQKLAAVIPGAEQRILDKQTHNVQPAALRPDLIRFLED